MIQGREEVLKAIHEDILESNPTIVNLKIMGADWKEDKEYVNNIKISADGFAPLDLRLTQRRCCVAHGWADANEAMNTVRNALIAAEYLRQETGE